jgi:hypothetical protein
MTVEWAFRQHPEVPQASNFDKVGSPDRGIKFPVIALIRTTKTFSKWAPFYNALERGGIPLARYQIYRERKSVSSSITH